MQNILHIQPESQTTNILIPDYELVERILKTAPMDKIVCGVGIAHYMTT
jgi:hypothetical protein